MHACRNLVQPCAKQSTSKEARGKTYLAPLLLPYCYSLVYSSTYNLEADFLSYNYVAYLLFCAILSLFIVIPFQTLKFHMLPNCITTEWEALVLCTER
jgi:hypothetical protein